jgi:hypothetical protein
MLTDGGKRGEGQGELNLALGQFPIYAAISRWAVGTARDDPL